MRDTLRNSTLRCGCRSFRFSASVDDRVGSCSNAAEVLAVKLSLSLNVLLYLCAYV